MNSENIKNNSIKSDSKSDKWYLIDAKDQILKSKNPILKKKNVLSDNKNLKKENLNNSNKEYKKIFKEILIDLKNIKNSI